jgi:hypothetical protein
MGKKKKAKGNAKGKKSAPLYVKKSQVPRVRQELLDADYLDKLSPKELAWHNKFTSEYVNAAISKDKKTKRVKKGHLHKSKAKAKECYDANNKRNNDLFGVTKANGLLSFDLPGIVRSGDDWYKSNPNCTEDALIAYLDYKNSPDEEDKEEK